MNESQINELLYQALETEIGGQGIYKAAISCAQNDELREEWGKYLEETENHERILREVFEKVSLDPQETTPGRKVVRHLGESLVIAMEMAKRSGDAVGAELVAAECVVLAETKDHANWELIGEVAKKATGEQKSALQEAFEQVEEQEDEHLYHTMGWARELWLGSLGLPAVLPPPEESRKVTTAIGAVRAKNARGSMLGNGRRKSTAANGRGKSTAANGSSRSTAANGRSKSTAANGRGKSTAANGRSKSTAANGRSKAAAGNGRSNAAARSRR